MLGACILHHTPPTEYLRKAAYETTSVDPVEDERAQSQHIFTLYSITSSSSGRLMLVSHGANTGFLQ